MPEPQHIDPPEEAVEAAETAALDKAVEGSRERLQVALASILGCCQEVAHEVEDPTQACGEIEGIVRKALVEEKDREKARHPGHCVVLAFDSGGMFARLVCPDNDPCEHTGSCPDCAADLTDPDSDRCEHCEEVSPGECWLQSWFDALDGEELLQGEIEFPVSVEWDGDAPQVQIEAGGDASCR